MKPITDLGPLLKRAIERHIFGTKNAFLLLKKLTQQVLKN